jgi:hypothetical protein
VTDDGPVTFEAYLPTSPTDCGSSGAALIDLGSDADGPPWSVTFTPDGVGLTAGEVYFFRIEYTGDDTGHGTDSSFLDTGCGALAVLEIMAPPPKVLEGGPFATDGTVCTDAVVDTDGFICDDGFNNLVVGPNDDGGIWVGLVEAQRYVYSITITEDGSITFPIVATDVAPADFDMDGAFEQDAVDGAGILPDPVTDNIDGALGLAGCGDGTCDGIQVVKSEASDTCVVSLQQPPNSPNKEPEFINIHVDLSMEETCTVYVFVSTVENPGQGNDLWEPTSCRNVAASLGIDPISDAFTLNEGIGLFDANGDGSDGTDYGDRIAGPLGSLQLTCNFVPAL